MHACMRPWWPVSIIPTWVIDISGAHWLASVAKLVSSKFTTENETHLWESEARLVYTVISKAARAIQWDPVFNNNNNKKVKSYYWPLASTNVQEYMQAPLPNSHIPSHHKRTYQSPSKISSTLMPRSSFEKGTDSYAFEKLNSPQSHLY